MLGVRHDAVRNAWPDMLEAALLLKRREEADRLVAMLADQSNALVPPYLRAQLARARALLAAAADQPEQQWLGAAQSLRSLGFAYWAARVDLDRARLLLAAGRSEDAEPLLASATATLTPLGAAPALAQAEELRSCGHAHPRVAG